MAAWRCGLPRLAAPLKLAFNGTGHVRGLLVLEAGAALTLVESVGFADFRNAGLEIVLGEGASLEHIRISPEAGEAVLVEEASLRIAAGGSYRAHFAGFGSKLSRMELEIALEGEGAEAHLSGVAVLDGKRHSDVTTHVIHRHGNTTAPNCSSMSRAARPRRLSGQGNGGQGRQWQRQQPERQGAAAGRKAEADLKPELEIFADDVKCAHGAAVGDLDAESLFYLQARGIPETEARGLLLHAFLEDAVAEIAMPTSASWCATNC